MIGPDRKQEAACCIIHMRTDRDKNTSHRSPSLSSRYRKEKEKGPEMAEMGNATEFKV
jgi:hypothetical protein